MSKFAVIIFLILTCYMSDAYAEGDLTKQLQQLYKKEEKDGVSLNSYLDDFETNYQFRKEIDSFLDAAFQTRTWYSSNLFDNDDSHVKNLPSFLREPILRKEGMPKYGVINKWKTTAQNAALDEPIIVDLVLVQLFNSSSPLDLNPYQKSLENTIRASISSINGSGVVRLSYDKMFDDIQDLQGQRIHIIPFLRSSDALEPKIKAVNAHIGGGVYHYSFGMVAAEMLLNGAVRFTPDSVSQVDGYFLPDKDNHITFAVCYINISNSEAVQKKYIDECLLRSLGLPGNAHQGLLSEKGIGSVKGMTEDDIQMLSWLYSPKIKTGDDKYEALQKLHSIKYLMKLE